MTTKPDEFDVCMKQIVEHIAALSSSKTQNDKPLNISELSATLNISNQNIKYQLQHGAAFKDLLDPRDQVLEH